MVSDAGRQLLFQGDDRLGVFGGEGNIVAIDAAADTLAAIAVGASETGVDVDLADPATEAAPQVVPVGMNAQFGMN